MKALDTNVLVRFLVNDDKKQGEKVKALFLKAEKKGSVFFISTPVLLELIYVLDSVYGFRREEIVGAFQSMMALPILEFDNTDAVQKLIASGKNTTTELEDLLVGLIAQEAGCETTITFDRKAAKSILFELLD